MKDVFLKIAMAGLMALVVSGCATRKEIVQFRQDVTYLCLQSDSLRKENHELKKMILGLNKNFLELQNETRRTKADLLTEIDQLKNQSQVIGSKLEDNTYRMSHLLQKAEPIVSPSPPKDSLDQAAGPDQPSNPPAQKLDIDPLQLYNAAYLDLSKGNYQLALQGFQQFLEKFPQTDLADNAQYWLGEVYYAQKDNQQAIEEFKKVIEKYPKGDKIAAALLKIGYCYFNMNDPNTGKKYLRIVTERFPNSEEARLARSRLATND